MKKFNVSGHEMVMLADVKWAIRKARKNIDTLYSDRSDGAKKLAREVLESVVRMIYIDEIRAASSQEDVEAILEMTGDFIVAKYCGKRRAEYFKAWDHGVAVITENSEEAMYFDYESMAEFTAGKLGPDWSAVDMCRAETESNARIIKELLE